jgi:hypothetical protein
MGRDVLQACLPWFGWLGASLLAAWLLLRANRSRLRLARLRMLHRNQYGGVQSLAFVLTLPLFIMVLMMIVQISQLMIATVTVHYAAYAAARSASVWIPAALEPEGPNTISAYVPDPDALDQDFPILDTGDPGYGPSGGGVTYIVLPDSNSPKWRKIHQAAVLACMAVSPSRETDFDVPAWAVGTSQTLETAYGSMVSPSGLNARIPARLRNKLAYAIAATEIEVRFFHQNREPPLTTYFQGPDPGEFYPNELGWQDVVTVTVHHQLALLPGPGRMLFHLRRPVGSDASGPQIRDLGSVYVYPLSASAVMGIEGEKPLVTYFYRHDGAPGASGW